MSQHRPSLLIGILPFICFGYILLSPLKLSAQNRPTDLGVLTGKISTAARGINNLGTVVGGSDASPFIYSGGVLQNLWQPYPDPNDPTKTIVPQGGAFDV